MKSYIHYVHDISDKSSSWFLSPASRKRSVEEFRKQFSSINELQQAILNESNAEVFKFISEHLDLGKYFRHIIFSTHSKSYVDNVDFSNVRAIINFKPINSIREINEHFKSVNTLLPDAGVYIGRIECYGERKNRFCTKYGERLGRLIWLIDFVLNRIIPKIRPLQSLYYFLTQGKNHVMSRAEILGRLVFNGFDIIEHKYVERILYFVVIKTREPQNQLVPSYNLIITLKRVGKNGKPIHVYKFRTMHPYSEFLHDYILKLNGYNQLGKPANDFRVARWGKFLRMLWLDELPQIINVLKGEMRLVGVRPLSMVRFNQLPIDLQNERIKQKPGWFPPYVALNMPDEKNNIEAERIYLKDHQKHPLITDIRYLIKAIYNIITNKIRSS